MSVSDDDQSINLSLRLRRGSSDSRDSFYMDLDRGIDSDIEMTVGGTEITPLNPIEANGTVSVSVQADCPSNSPPCPPVLLNTTAVGQNELIPAAVTRAVTERHSLSSGECSSEPYLEGDYPASHRNDWAGLEPPDTPPDSPDAPISPETQLLTSSSSSKPTIIPCGDSFSVPTDSLDQASSQAVSPTNPDLENGTEIVGVRGSEDSGLGTNSHQLNHSPQRKKPPQLALDLCVQRMPPSRSSSFHGSCASLACTTGVQENSFYNQHLEKTITKGLLRENSVPEGSLYAGGDSRASSMLSLNPIRPYGDRSVQCDALVVMLSAVYAKLLVVMGICFPVAEVISHRIPISYYEANGTDFSSTDHQDNSGEWHGNGQGFQTVQAFYLYLYVGSIVFLFYVYVFLLRNESKSLKTNGDPSKPGVVQKFLKRVNSVTLQRSNSAASGVFDQNGMIKKKVDDVAHCGSFYLRLGAVAFGIGSMIYSGLEFGQFFEVEVNSKCYNILYSITPTAHMVFTFIQLYFIFLNSRRSINKYKTVARFGLMHMIATNLCVWLRVLVQETKHQIVMLNLNETHKPTHSPTMVNLSGLEASTVGSMSATLASTVSSVASTVASTMASTVASSVAASVSSSAAPTETINVNLTESHHIVRRSMDQNIYTSHECRRSNIMGQLVQDASQFLFPCTIEYSLICAAILYIMWKNTGKSSRYISTSDRASVHSAISTRHRHYYQVDCARANKGLFTGILVLVLSIICLIIFFVLINNPQYKNIAVLEAHIAELALYCVTTLAVIIALFQVRELKFYPGRNIELDNILLVVAQTGLYLFTMFSIIGGHFTMDQNTILVLLTALACLIQGTMQTIFILDASRRYARSSDQIRRKPGREMVTFLLVCNFAMWAINTLETRRADSNPVQMHFYGFWAWTIITHVTTPLTIFFRFHSTVCLCDIWKRTYKVRAEYV